MADDHPQTDTDGDGQAEAAAPRPRRGRPRHEVPSPEYLARREEIVATAAIVFQARGYDAGSLDDVAAVLDMRKASLYYYVRSKGELLYLVFDRAITTAIEQLHQLASLSEPGERLAALIRHQVVVVASDPSLFAVFFDQRPGLDDEYVEEMRRKERQYIREYVQAVEDAVAVGALVDDEPRYLAQAILGMTSWVYKWFDPARDDPERFAETCVRLILGSEEPGA